MHAGHLVVVSTSGQQGAIGREGQGGGVKEVALLPEDIGLAAPLPHQQLAQGCAPKSQPVPPRIPGHCIDGLMGDAQHMQVGEVWQLHRTSTVDGLVTRGLCQWSPLLTVACHTAQQIEQGSSAKLVLTHVENLRHAGIQTAWKQAVLMRTIPYSAVMALCLRAGQRAWCSWKRPLLKPVTSRQVPWCRAAAVREAPL